MKAELWRAIARRWLEQFSNVQNAVEAYEKLHAVDPRDREAIDSLKELYTKRRAYKPLYDLLEREAAELPGRARSGASCGLEMAKLAAERLDTRRAGGGALQARPRRGTVVDGALDALEKQAERDKDFATVAEVLERRAVARRRRCDAARRAPEARDHLLRAPPRSRQGHERLAARARALQPGHAKALRVLRDSYLAVGDYDGLTELYAEQRATGRASSRCSRGAADKATDAQLKVDL